VLFDVSILVEMNSVTLPCFSISRTIKGTCDRRSSMKSFEIDESIGAALLGFT
jgi:hypothetical protein